MAMSGVVPVLDVSVTDTTGAGDAFLAGTSTALLHACSIHAGWLAGRRQRLRVAWLPCAAPAPVCFRTWHLAAFGFGPGALASDTACPCLSACGSAFPASAPALDPAPALALPLPFPAGFLFYMLLSGGLDSLVADPSKVTALFSICLPSICLLSSACFPVPAAVCFLRFTVCAVMPPPRPACPLQLRRGVEFATACGAFTCTKPGAIGAQPTAAEAEALLAEKSST